MAARGVNAIDAPNQRASGGQALITWDKESQYAPLCQENTFSLHVIIKRFCDGFEMRQQFRCGVVRLVCHGCYFQKEGGSAGTAREGRAR